jgi:hypothetical protein
MVTMDNSTAFALGVATGMVIQLLIALYVINRFLNSGRLIRTNPGEWPAAYRREATLSKAERGGR